MIKEGIEKLVEGENLTGDEAQKIMLQIISGGASDAQTASLLTALRMKGETVEEITAFAQAMRRVCRQIHPQRPGLVDTCGTGGDSVKTFNISTIAALVAAGAGIPIAKHGNRSVTSSCGSADLLEALGYNLSLSPERVEKSIEYQGIGFLYAPVFHPAMKHAVQPRKEIGIRSVFNILGPLTNPANARFQLLGVYHESLTETLAQVLKNLGVETALIVHGLDGLDEISTLGETKLTLLHKGEISTTEASPKDFGVKKADAAVLKGSTPPQSAHMALRLLTINDREEKVKREIVLVNAAAAIYITGRSDSIKEGIEIAKESLESGAALKKLKELISYSGGDRSKIEEVERAL